MSESLASLLSELQGLGFLEGRSTEDCGEKAQAYWGLEIPQECDSISQARVMLLCLDNARVWHGQSNGIESPDCYRRLLEELSAVSEDLFLPREIEVGDRRVSFRCQGYRYQFEPASGDYFDMRILQVVNWAIIGPRCFQCLDTLGMPNVVFLVNDDEKADLAKLFEGSFVDSLTAVPDYEYQGFISDFWEQGMEESPWLTFQDQRLCKTPLAGWDRAGMYRLKVGSRLRIFEDDGGVLWQGTLGHDQRGLLGRLTGKPISAKPPDVDQTTWDSWFRKRPPLRCFSSGIARQFI